MKSRQTQFSPDTFTLTMRNPKILLTFFILLLFSFWTAQFDEQIGPRLQIIPAGFSVPADWFRQRDRFSRLELLRRTLHHIEESYVDPERIDPQKMFKSVLNRISEIIPEARVLYPGANRAALLVGNNRMEFDTNVLKLYALHASISDALKFVRANARSDEISEKELESATIGAVLSTLDPHSTFLNKDVYSETKVGTSGKFGGLGIVIGIRDNKLTIIAPLEDTPAFRVGLKAADHITKIGEESTINMLLTEAVSKMRGPKGVPITITVMREGFTAPRPFTIVRDIIRIVSVESQLLPRKIGYLKLKSFQGNTTRDLNRHLRKLRMEARGPLRGFILDLRNNPGGLLDQAVAVSDKFLSNGSIVTTVGHANHVREREMATNPGSETDFPMIVLVNEGSASASEIVSGALQQQDRAMILGQRTFGKGTVQSIFDLPEDTALKLTIAKYLTPGGVSIQSTGIHPDLRLSPATVTKEEIDLFRSPKRFSEADLEGHFENHKTGAKIANAADIELHYLEERDEEAREDEYSQPQSTKGGAAERIHRYLQDFAVRAASTILSETSGPTRQDVLAATKKFVMQSNREQSDKIVTALKAHKIDWSPGPQHKPQNCGIPKARPTISASVAQPAKAGEKLQIDLALDNPGPCTLYRAWTLSGSESYLFKDREFLFGKVGPGKRATQKVEFEIPKSMPSVLAEIKLTFQEANDLVPKDMKIWIPISSIPKPEFAFNYEIHDIHGENPGDGLIQKGETIELKLRVRNVGNGPTEKASASIKNKNGKTVFLKRGRAPVKVLQPGQEQVITFQFEVRPFFRKRKVNFDLTISDTVYRTFLSKKLELPVIAPERVTARNAGVVIEKDNTPLYTLPSRKAPILGMLSSSSQFPTLVEAEGFVRVALPGKRYGWVPRQNVRSISKVSKSSSVQNVRWTGLQPPHFETKSEELAFQLAEGQFIRLTGDIVDDESVRDFFVFVNKRKVHYESFAEGPQAAARQHFDTSIPLEKGINRIVLIARDGQDLRQQKAFVVQRLATSGADESLAASKPEPSAASPYRHP